MALDFPVIYLLPTHLSPDELHDLESQIPDLTYDINEASVVLGKISEKNRAQFELRKRKLLTQEVPTSDQLPSSPRAKRRKISSFGDVAVDIHTDSDTMSDGDTQLSTQLSSPEGMRRGKADALIRVVKLAWFTDSISKGEVLPVADYLIYQGRKITSNTTTAMKPPPRPADILERAKADAGGTQMDHYLRHGPFRKDRDRDAYKMAHVKPPALLKQTTSEHDIDEYLPPIPKFLHTTYSCQRPTLVNPPNKAFIEELKKIRTTRTLTGDQIGVRAYSSSIATIAAYPYTLRSAQEVARLPGCGTKVAELFQEFKESGSLKEARDAEADPKLSVLRLFYEIWGVADATAREFYNRGWRDLDDIVEYGWNTLSRVQQIGVKYYDEFQVKIPREEVAAISDIILDHANKIHKGFQMVIVGGYRRGKEMSGDVDVVLSHPDESATEGVIEDIVLSLEKDRYITHTLSLSTKNSERGQEPVSWKGNEKKARGAGFDTLDKALVVWQDPKWTPEEGEAKNPNLHRRVDIIISPWKTTGCAVLGWTSGTTFQRDLRRYCKRERGLKFDSSGIRSRVDGAWVDLEDGGLGKAPDMLTAERRVFAGLGLEWRPPEERCTE